VADVGHVAHRTGTLRRSALAAAAVVAGTGLLGSTVLTGVAAAATASPLAATTAGTAQAAGTVQAAGASHAALQAQADTLASQIRSQSVQINQLAEQADAAQLADAQASTQLVAARKVKAETDAEMAVARRTLRTQALAAYMDDGQATHPLVPLTGGTNPSLVDGYAEIVAGGQQGAIQRYQLAERQQATATAALVASQAQAAASVSHLHQAQLAAEAAQTGGQRTLDSVTGRLAALVSAAEATQAQTEATQEQATLAADHDLPATAPATQAPPTQTPATQTPATQTPATQAAPAAPAAKDTPAATAPPVTAPVITAAPTTAARIPVAPVTAPPTTATPVTTAPAPAVPQVEAPGAGVAIAWAEAEIGKPYQWGGAGPASFDCSGLVMDAWGAAGVSFPHLAQDQYDMTARVALSQLLPGDLVFFGTPSDVYHVGIYVGGSQMVDAPETGQDVQIQSIYETDLLGGGRVS
jgi:cell wall-associated NlpC family hydrolase